METKHAPGPWTAHSYVGCWCVIHSENGVFRNIALVPAGERDATLIAAAPELLEALQNLLAVRRGEGGTKPNADALAKAAIAKATGMQANTALSRPGVPGSA